jgi:hypothetical protein
VITFTRRIRTRGVSIMPQILQSRTPLEKKKWSVPEVASILGKSPQTIRKAIKSGKVNAGNDGTTRDSFFFVFQDLSEWLGEHRAKALFIDSGSTLRKSDNSS